MNTRNLTNATVTVTGGTGSFGTTIVNYFLANHPEINEIRVFSRDENKQDGMRRVLDSTRVKFYLGDTRDISSVDSVMNGSDLVFHAAALKQVPSCEFFPEQAVMTNIQGSINVFNSAIKNSVSSVVALSTDKAVYPINSMGMTKAVMERVAQSYARSSNSSAKTIFSVTRYGNVMMSRGSVIPLFLEQLMSSRSVTITNPKMTRFLMTLEESVDLVLHAFLNSEDGDLYVKKAPACTVEVLAEAIAQTLNLDSFQKIFIGHRHGEKLHESLLSSEESIKSEDQGNYFRVPLDTRTLNYRPYFEEGNIGNSELSMPYTSGTTTQLAVNDVVKKLMEMPLYRKSIGVATL
jgi:UDP-glucose 4-epimerase